MKADTKPPVLLIHGMWSDANTLHEVTSAFEESGYTAQAVTLPYHCPRARHTATSRNALAATRLQDYVACVLEQVQQLDAPPILVGHSMGGLIAQLVAARVPCERLILLSSAAPAGINSIRWSVLKTLGRNLFHFPLWKRLTALSKANIRYGIANAQPPSIQEEIEATSGYESGFVTVQMTLGSLTRRVFSRIEPEKLTCPTLIIGGTEDRITPIKVQRRIAQHYRNQPELIEIPGCCHWTIGGAFFPEVRKAMFYWLATKPAPSPHGHCR
ncbi:alpha/beta hydrolase [Marinobacter daepoensis]|uniref:alpha/beta hydrolase n=1 Tax=Marinobacter daepoensis TaxID=262077 RepID=UPI0003FFE609|nr:alpha/beta hydrolase [Marinobacter daepoensis]